MIEEIGRTSMIKNVRDGDDLKESDVYFEKKALQDSRERRKQIEELNYSLSQFLSNKTIVMTSNGNLEFLDEKTPYFAKGDMTESGQHTIIMSKEFFHAIPNERLKARLGVNSIGKEVIVDKEMAEAIGSLEGIGGYENAMVMLDRWQDSINAIDAGILDGDNVGEILPFVSAIFTNEVTNLEMKKQHLLSMQEKIEMSLISELELEPHPMRKSLKEFSEANSEPIGTTFQSPMLDSNRTTPTRHI